MSDSESSILGGDDSYSESAPRKSSRRRRRRRKKRSSMYSPPAHRNGDRRSTSKSRKRKRGRKRSPSRSRSRGGGGGGGGGGKGGGGKGKMCWDFINKRCRRGDECHLSHDKEERRRLLDMFGQQACKMGARCNRPGCFYAHPGDKPRRRESSSSSDSEPREEVKIPMMKAVGFKAYGDVPVLEDLRMPKPYLEPKGNDMLVRLHGIVVNPLSLKKGAGAVSTDMVPYGLSGHGGDQGLVSAAGVIEGLSEGARASGKFKVGDAVWFADNWDSKKESIDEYCLVDYRVTSLKPNALSFADAASIPLAALTAWGSLIERMNLDFHLFFNGIRLPRFTTENKAVFLALPGACAAGSFALQLAAKYLNKNKNLVIIASASRPESVEWCKKMGAEHVINHDAYNLKDELDKIGIKGLDYVFYGTSPPQHESRLYEVMNSLGQIASYHEGDFEKRDACLAKRVALHRERIGLDKFLEVDGDVLATVARLFDDPTLGLESVVKQRYPDLTAEAVRQAQTWYTVRAVDVDAMGAAVFEVK